MSLPPSSEPRDAYGESGIRPGLFVRLAPLPGASFAGADLVGWADVVGQVVG
jgi:hypothetical protein